MENNDQRRKILDRDGKYWVEWVNIRQKWEILDRDEKYWTAWGNIG